MAGPALVRMLIRYRAPVRVRLEGSPLAAGPAHGPLQAAAAVLAALLIASAALPARSATTPRGRGAAGGRRSWMRAAQNADGGFGFGPGEDSSPAMTGWAVLGLEGAGVNPLDLSTATRRRSPTCAGTIGEVRTTGDLERTILALRGRRGSTRGISTAGTWSPG